MWLVPVKTLGSPAVELLEAAAKLAAHLGYTDFKRSEGWLWQFRNCHGLFSKVLHGEAVDADTASVAPFH